MIRKGVILAGGTGSRLMPCTKITNKHLLPVYDRPMIFYPLETLKKAGITDILLISGTESCGDFMKLLGSGDEYGVHLTFRVQNTAGGIADALKLAENFAAGESIAVILGDNIFADDFASDITEFTQGAKIFVKEVADPNRFGVATIKNNVVTKIIEKPKNPESPFAVTGLYLYDQTIFEKLKMLSPSERGEYEISEINQMYIDQQQLLSKIITGSWSDAGTHESLYVAASIARELALAS